VASFVILWVIKKVIGLRVTEEEEVMGLDLSEHGAYGYPEQLQPPKGAIGEPLADTGTES
jgi:ammonium transporter, Amt family